MQLLPVSHYPQRQQSECLDYLQVPSDYRNLLKLLRIKSAGAPFRNLRYLKSLGVSVLIERGDIETLSVHLDRGLPPICFVATRYLSYWDEETGHAVVVVGLEGDRIHLSDPRFPDAPKVIPVDEFELAWIDLDQFYALVTLD